MNKINMLVTFVWATIVIILFLFFCSPRNTGGGGHLCIHDWVYHRPDYDGTPSASGGSCGCIVLAHRVPTPAQGHRSSASPTRVSQPSLHNTGAGCWTLTGLPLLIRLISSYIPNRAAQNDLLKGDSSANHNEATSSL